jgi:hypothetical protein
VTLYLRLAALCPGCERRPSVRATPRMVALASQCEPDELLGSHECHRCRTVYPLAAVAYQHAEVVEERAA